MSPNITKNVKSFLQEPIKISVKGKKHVKLDSSAFFEDLRKRVHRKEQPGKYKPYLLIRSIVGDNGTRPLPAGLNPYESPDIWVYTGTQPSQGGGVKVGETYHVAAHIWNLGETFVTGALVEYYWFRPFLGLDSANANLIGMERVDLAPRGYPGCHKLVVCKTPYIVQPLSDPRDHHPCLVVRVSGYLDPLNSAYPWSFLDRHVAQKNLTVLDAAAAKLDLQHLLLSLETTKPKGSTVRLFQVGKEATQLLAMAAPHLKMDPALITTLLAELSADNKLTLPPVKTDVARMMPHLLLNLGTKPSVKTAKVKVSVDAKHPNLLHEKGDVSLLLQHGNLLTPEQLQKIKVLPPPKKGFAQVLRILAYEEGKTEPSGGYSIIING